SRQIKQRVSGEPITDRLISLWDPDARPIRKGKLSKPTEFGYVDQLCEVTANTKRGARGFILPPASPIGNSSENTLLPDIAAELKVLGVKLREIVLDGGFMATPTNTALEGLTDTVHITGRQEQGSRRTRTRTRTRTRRRRRRRRQRYRTGAEGRISHLKRSYQLDRTRLKGRRRPPDLGRLGDPYLQHRHPHHPEMSPDPAGTEPGTGQPEPRKPKPDRKPNPAPRRRPHSDTLTAPARQSGGSS
ncbi:MAG: transposase, partial [Solirubrobacteraceae bacterium]